MPLGEVAWDVEITATRTPGSGALPEACRGLCLSQRVRPGTQMQRLSFTVLNQFFEANGSHFFAPKKGQLPFPWVVTQQPCDYVCSRVPSFHL